MDRLVLGRQIRAARRAAGLNLRELAERAQIKSFQYVGKLENGGGNPTIGVLEKLADACNAACYVEIAPASQEKLEPADADVLREVRALLPRAPEDAKQALLVMLRHSASKASAASGE